MLSRGRRSIFATLKPRNFETFSYDTLAIPQTHDPQFPVSPVHLHRRNRVDGFEPNHAKEVLL